MFSYDNVTKIDVRTHPLSWAALLLAVAMFGGVPVGHADEPDTVALQTQMRELHRAERYAEAAALGADIVDIRRETLGERHKLVAASLFFLAKTRDAQGDKTGARRLYEESIDIWREALGPRHANVAAGLNRLGILLENVGDYPAAQRAFEENLDIRREALGPRHVGVTNIMNRLASVLEIQGDYAAARALYEECLDIRREAHGSRHVDVATSLNNLAILLRRQGDFNRARPLLEESLAISREVRGARHVEVAASLNNLASVHEGLGEYQTARLLYEESFDIFREAFGKGHPRSALTLHNLANVLYILGDHAAARPLFEESVQRLREALGPRHLHVGGALNNLARVLEAQGDYSAARPLLEEAIDIARDALGPRHPTLPVFMSRLAGVLEADGDHASARAMLEESLAIQREALAPGHPDVALGLGALASMLRAEGDYTGAEALYEESLEALRDTLGARHPHFAATLGHLGVLHGEQREYAAARALLEESLDILRETHGPEHPEVAKSLGHLASVLEAQGDIDAARSIRTEALAITEDRLSLLDALSEREALAYLESTRGTLDSWLAVHDALEQPELAWTHTLRWKGTLSARQRDARAFATLDPDTAAARSALMDVRRDLARHAFAEVAPGEREAHREKLAALSTRAEQLERALLASSAEFRRTRALELATPSDLCAALPEDTALVDFLRIARGDGEAGYLAFAMSDGCTVHRVDLGLAQPIDDAVADWRAVLSAPSALGSRIDTRGAALFERLWAPLAPVLDDTSRVLVIPDGSLAAVPFAALPQADGRYLLEDFYTGYLDRANDLLLPGSEVEASGALILGGVDFDAGGSDDEEDTDIRSALAPCVEAFDPLPGTVREAEDLARRWRRSRRKDPLVTLEGGQATEAAVSAALQGKAVAHLATHGFFATSAGCHSRLEGTGGVGYDPMLLSGLAVAGANRPVDPFASEDGILTAREVASLDLSGTGLVVLSACETGIGEVRSGQGVLGLRRAFAISGVQTLVMTLWSVGDDEAATLMDGLYDRVVHRRPLPAGEALREAQLEVLRDNREALGEARPGAWAAWVASGR